MPQFAVIARSFRRLAASEHAGDVAVIRMNLDRRRQSARCIFEKPKAYLISAADADAAMSLVQRFASSVDLELIVHRAVEVCHALTSVDELAEFAAKRK